MIPDTEERYKDFTPSNTSVSNIQPVSTGVKLSSEYVSARPSSVHGLGVFAEQNFNKNDIIEKFPIVPMSFRTHYQGDARVLDYGAVKFCECEECKKHGYVIFLRLGYGSLYNHQDNHNAALYINYNEFYGECRAEKNINAGEEIFVNYGDKYIFQEGKNTIRE